MNFWTNNILVTCERKEACCDHSSRRRIKWAINKNKNSPRSDMDPISSGMVPVNKFSSKSKAPIIQKRKLGNNKSPLSQKRVSISIMDGGTL